jgi:hypothetical protein
LEDHQKDDDQHNNAYGDSKDDPSPIYG